MICGGLWRIHNRGHKRVYSATDEVLEHENLETSIPFKYYPRPALASLFSPLFTRFRVPRAHHIDCILVGVCCGDPLSAKYIVAGNFGMLASNPLEIHYKGIDSLKTPTTLHIFILLDTRSHVQDQRETNSVQARVSCVCGSKSPPGL